MNRAVIDHRGAEFGRMTLDILDRLKVAFGTSTPVFVFASSGSGAWEAALVNTLSHEDTVVAFDQGFFADRWADVAHRLGLRVERIPGEWRRPVDTEALSGRLAADKNRQIAAVLVVHNETSTGVTSDIGAVRAVLDDLDHPALLMVDAVSSLAAMPFEQDVWRVDVTVSGSQKGLMLPPGLSFNAVSDRALAATEKATLYRAYWDWAEMARLNKDGFFPSTPATTLLYGLQESLTMLEDEGYSTVYARHARHAAATRIAVDTWGLENHCADPDAFSNAGTTVMVPAGTDANELRATILERFDMSLGGGLGRLRGRVFRIGHLGDFNDLMLAGALSGVEMGLAAAGVPHSPGGVGAALAYLSDAGSPAAGSDQ
jgi:alanine-glyoxylate transaminase/serine-glyoxylate transaminase/serine-pyruvate transaminase